MKVKELIKELKELPPELEVLIYTDHGQTPSHPFSISRNYVHIDGRDIDIVAEEDLEEYMDDLGVSDLEQCVIIDGE